MLSAFLGVSAAGAGAGPARSDTGQIRWDKYAVPHIYAADIPGAAHGLGYATVENHAELLLRKIARARGQLALYFGAGADGGNVLSDEQVIGYGLPRTAAALALRQNPFGRTVAQAFCDGVNEYAARHPADVPAALTQILPMTPTDVVAIGLYVAFLQFENGQSFVSELVQAWQSGTPIAKAHRAVASNAIVIGPKRSRNGNAILVANSHLPWGDNQSYTGADGYFSAVQFMEAHLVIGDPAHPTLNAAGATWIGLPFLAEGFSDDSGWTSTANTIYNADVFQLQLADGGRAYRYGHEIRPFERSVADVKIREAGGTFRSVEVQSLRSVHGPVIAVDTKRGLALAVRNAGLEQPNIISQYWDMLRSRNLVQFKAAVSALQLPLFNLFFADRDGEIYYLYGGRQPVRSCPFSLQFAGGVLLPPIQDGTDPACLWTHTFKLDQLPQAENPPGGYFANGNEAPWYASFPRPGSLDPTLYPSYLTPDGVDFRPQHLHRALASQPTFDPQCVLAIKNSDRLLLAARVLPDLLTLARNAGKRGDTIAEKAADTLAAWDQTADAASVGGTLFEAWWDAVASDVLSGAITPDIRLAYSYNAHPAFRLPFDPALPLTTPSGLAPVNNARLLADLDSAYRSVSSAFARTGGALVRWGDAHRLTLATRSGLDQQTVRLPLVTDAPLSGADDEFGGIRIVNPTYDPALGAFASYGGESYIHVVEFTKNGAVGGSLLVYGNASRPNSPHIGDQAALFGAKTLKPELRSLAEVEVATVRVEPY